MHISSSHRRTPAWVPFLQLHQMLERQLQRQVMSKLHIFVLNLGTEVEVPHQVNHDQLHPEDCIAPTWSIKTNITKVCKMSIPTELTQTILTAGTVRQKGSRMSLLDPFFGEILRIELLRFGTPNVRPFVHGVQAHDEDVTGRHLDAVDFDLGRVLPGHVRHHRTVPLDLVDEHVQVGELFDVLRSVIGAIAGENFGDFGVHTLLNVWVERKEETGMGRRQTGRVGGLEKRRFQCVFHKSQKNR